VLAGVQLMKNRKSTELTEKILNFQAANNHLRRWCLPNGQGEN
jgi:hypothetical protein